MATVYNCTGCNKFFDSSKYATCPFCGLPVGASPAGGVPKVEETKKESGFLGIFHKREKDDNKVVVMEEDVASEAGTFGTIVSSNGSVENVGDNPVVNVFEKPDDEEIVEIEEDDDVVEEPTFDITPSYVEEEMPSNAVPPQQPVATSIGSAIATSVKMDDEKTSGFFAINSKKNTQPATKEVEVQSVAQVIETSDEPVVAWLVGISGPYFGQSLKLFAGRNSIGRNPSNRVVLAADKGVSREKHAWITYEPKKRVFFIQSGDSSGLTYLNDEAVMETKNLGAFDTIGIGSGTYKFVPLCGENFSWEDYID